MEYPEEAYSKSGAKEDVYADFTRASHTINDGPRPAGILSNMIHALAILEGELNSHCQRLTHHSDKMFGIRPRDNPDRGGQKMPDPDGDITLIANKIDSINRIVADIATEITRIETL